MRQETSGDSKGERIKFTGPDGEITLPKLRKGRYINFTVVFDVRKDWRLIQLLYSIPPRERSRTFKNLLAIVLNAAALASERQPLLTMRGSGKKLTREQVRKRLQSAFKPS